MNWQLSNRGDPYALPIANRHYNRQKPESNQFVPPGKCIVLLTPKSDALWVSSWPIKEYVKHQWAGAWICTCFRNESNVLSSLLIKEAVAVTKFIWGEPPNLGMVTFINLQKVRKKRDWGRCYRKAGWTPCGSTKGGLLALHILPDQMPQPMEAYDPQLKLL